MKHVDLFSGIGGFALACDWAGIETVCFVEIDKFCQKVLKKHWPNVPIVEDVNNVEEIKAIITANAELCGCLHGQPEKQPAERRQQAQPDSESGCEPSVLSSTGIASLAQGEGRERWRGREGDSARSEARLSGCKDSLLLTGGFPCQPFSNAGRKRGASDSRYLWPQTLAVIKAVQPDWIILENVAGLLNMVFPDSETRVASQASFCEVPNDEIADYNTISGGIDRDLTEAGYETVWLVIPACSLGAPHRRDRVWIICQRISKDTNSQRGSRGSENSRQVLGCGSTKDKVERPNSEGGIVANRKGNGLYGRAKTGDNLRERTLGKNEPDNRNTMGSEFGSCDAECTIKNTTSNRHNRTRVRESDTDIQGREDAEEVVEQRDRRWDETCGTNQISNGWHENWYEVAGEFCRVAYELPDWLDRHYNLIIREDDYNATSKEDRIEGVRILWEAIQSEQVRERVGGILQIPEKEVLLTFLLHFQGEPIGEGKQVEGEEDGQIKNLRSLWDKAEFRCTPQRRELYEQRARELVGIVPQLPLKTARTIAKIADYIVRAESAISDKNRVPRLKSLGNAIVPQVAYQLIKAIKETAI